MHLAFVLTTLSALPAAAMPNPCYLDQDVAAAVHVIQVTDHEVTVPEGGGFCVLTGTVVRSFRGGLAPGSLVQTSFYCGEMTLGGISWSRESVAQAAVVEIHAAAEGGPAGGGWGLVLLDAPTDEPAFRFQYLPEEGGSC